MSSFDKFEETLTKLSDIQKQAVLSEAESLQILAGPGSGKTRVLTLRVAQLVVRKKIEPCNILVVTFTRKAANEMIERLNVLIGQAMTKKLIIGTFHSICSRFLRQYGEYVGLNTSFVIIDLKESKQILTEIRTDNNLALNSYVKGWKIGAILKRISNVKNDGLSPQAYAEVAYTGVEKDISKFYTRYEEELDKNNLVDFDNLLFKTCQLLRIKEFWGNVETVLVDEYQDTNLLQYDFIKLLVHQKKKKTLTIVGDPDQSIFGWRNAEPKNFNKMREDFEGTEVIAMEQNYRSSGTILASSRHVICQDKNRMDKTSYTNNPEGIPISIINTKDEHDQAEFVATEIKRVVKYSKGLITYKDIAVLMRMNYISQKFEYTFRKHRIPYTVAKGDRFFGRIEVQDIIAYLRLAHNPADSRSFRRIVNVPKRGVGDAYLKLILDFKEKNGINFVQTLEEIAMKKKVVLNEQICRKLVELYKLFLEIRNHLEERTDLSEIIEWIILATKYEEYLKEDGKTKAKFEERWANLGELVSLAKSFDSPDEQEDIDSSVYVSSQEPNSQRQNPPSADKKMDEDDIYEVDEVIDEEVVDSASQNSKTNNTQEYNSQNVIFTQTQKSESEDILEEAFQQEFDVDDKPRYVVPKTILQDFLEYCSLSSDEKELEAVEEGKVTVATMHSSKGLEWPCVFIVTCNETVVPMNTGNTDEEGRLLYVAMTRSKFLLYCVIPDNLEKFGQSRRYPRSRFLDGMEKQLFVDRVPDWNNSVRRLLSKILKRPVPPNDDSLSTTNKEFDDDGEIIETVDIRFTGENCDVVGELTPATNKREGDFFNGAQKRVKFEEE